MQDFTGRDMDEITAFLAVAETGAFARAARRLERDPTVLSRRISALEARLGVRLIERSTRKLALTEAGRSFAHRARAALAGLEEAEQEAREAAQRVTGTLRLALPAAFGRMWVAPLLPEFLQRHPGLRLEASFEDRFVDLIGETVDLALRIGALPDSGLVARRIAGSRRLLCAAPAYLAAQPPVTAPADLARHACLAFTGLRTHPDWRFRRPDGAGIVSVRVSGPLASGEAGALVPAALAGLGVLLCSGWLVAPHLASGALVPVLDDWRAETDEAISLLRPSGRYLPARVRLFGDWLTERLRAQPWNQMDAAGSSGDAGMADAGTVHG